MMCWREVSRENRNVPPSLPLVEGGFLLNALLRLLSPCLSLFYRVASKQNRCWYDYSIPGREHKETRGGRKLRSRTREGNNNRKHESVFYKLSSYFHTRVTLTPNI